MAVILNNLMRGRCRLEVCPWGAHNGDVQAHGLPGHTSREDLDGTIHGLCKG
jgi:hypothetical protein